MRTPFNRLAAGAWLLLAGAAAARAAGVFAWSDAAHLSLCWVKTLTGFACPGCGMMRGLVALFGGRLAEAHALHPLAPAVGLVWTAWMLAGFPRARAARERAAVRLGALTSLTALLAVYAQRWPA